MQRRGWLAGLFGAIRSLVVATLLCLTPPTSILVLGWLLTDMRRAALRRAGLPVAPSDMPRWLLGPAGSGPISRVLGGLARNIRTGLNAALCILAATLPFTGFWLSAWWAGWENSFNKGYEQAFVGPLLGLGGIGVFVLVMVYLPMALAHQAVEQRAFAFFELKRVRSAVAYSGWRYVLLAAVTVIFALPIFASRGLPNFAEGFYPRLAEMTPEQVAALRFQIRLATAGYVFVSLVILRRWSARIYSTAVLQAAAGPDRDLWANTALSAAIPAAPGRRPRRLFRIVRFLLLLACWFGLAVLIFVGQFLNHDWLVWLSHPYVFLPWVK